MLSHSMNKVLLADHDKFNQIALYKTADVSELDVIITDKKHHLILSISTNISVFQL